jgi:hypothetical protein
LRMTIDHSGSTKVRVRRRAAFEIPISGKIVLRSAALCSDRLDTIREPGTAALVGGNRRCSGQLPQQLMISIRPFRLRWEPWS